MWTRPHPRGFSCCRWVGRGAPKPRQCPTTFLGLCGVELGCGVCERDEFTPRLETTRVRRVGHHTVRSVIDRRRQMGGGLLRSETRWCSCREPNPTRGPRLREREKRQQPRREPRLRPRLPAGDDRESRPRALHRDAVGGVCADAWIPVSTRGISRSLSNRIPNQTLADIGSYTPFRWFPHASGGDPLSVGGRGVVR